MLHQHRMYFNNTATTLVCVNEGVSLPVVRKLGHAYFERGSDMLYTSSELQKVHRRFFHAKREMLYSVMKRADAANVVPNTLKQL